MSKPRVAINGLFIFLLLAFAAFPAGAAVLDVTVSGQTRLYVDTNWNGIIEPDTDGYYTLIYDDERFVLAVLGHNGMAPDAASGEAILFRMSGTPGGDITATEITEATLGGVNYTDFNHTHGIPMIVLTFGKREGASTYNYFRSFVSNSLPNSDFNLEGFLRDSDEADGIYDALFVPEHWGDHRKWDGAPVADTLYSLNSVSAVQNEVTYYTFGLGALQTDGSMKWGACYMPVDAQGALTFKTVNETLLGMPVNPATWEDPGAPGYMTGTPADDGDGNVAGDDDDNDTDPWQKFCFIGSTIQTDMFKALHVQAARVFMSSICYPVAGLLLCLAVLLGGVVVLRKKGFGKDL